MANLDLYRQCKLRKATVNGYLIDIAYIPIKFAVVGKSLEIRNSNKEWISGWIVVEVGKTRSSDELIQLRSQQHDIDWRLGNG